MGWERYVNATRPKTQMTRTALHSAAFYRMFDTVDYLVNEGADPTLQTSSPKGEWGGRTPFMIAILQKNDDVACRMLDRVVADGLPGKLEVLLCEPDQTQHG